MICFDTITASKIMNDLVYCDTFIEYQKDSILFLNEAVKNQKIIIQGQEKEYKIKRFGFIISNLTTIFISIVGYFAAK